jgi:hypothetical protein
MTYIKLADGLWKSERWSDSTCISIINFCPRLSFNTFSSQDISIYMGCLSHSRQMLTHFEHSLVAGHGLNYGSLPTASASEGY